MLAQIQDDVTLSDDDVHARHVEPAKKVRDYMAGLPIHCFKHACMCRHHACFTVITSVLHIEC